MKNFKKLFTPLIAALLVFAMTFSAFASVGTEVNARELFVADKAERVIFDVLDVVIDKLIKGIASFIPTPKYWFDKEDASSMADKIREIVSISKEELFKKGNSAREYAMNTKNHVVQTKKMLEFFERELNV